MFKAFCIIVSREILIHSSTCYTAQNFVDEATTLPFFTHIFQEVKLFLYFCNLMVHCNIMIILHLIGVVADDYK